MGADHNLNLYREVRCNTNADLSATSGEGRSL